MPLSNATAGEERALSSYVVETTGLTKRFGGKTVVDHVDLHDRIQAVIFACETGLVLPGGSS
jgi:hypothetical protein